MTVPINIPADVLNGNGNGQNQGSGDQTERVFTQTGSGTTVQNISITDAVCEGPVAGLKRGLGSIFFDDIPVKDAKYLGYRPPQGPLGISVDPTAKISFSLKTGTLGAGATLPDYMIDTADGTYYALNKSIILQDYLKAENLKIVNSSRNSDNKLQVSIGANFASFSSVPQAFTSGTSMNFDDSTLWSQHIVCLLSSSTFYGLQWGSFLSQTTGDTANNIPPSEFIFYANELANTNISNGNLTSSPRNSVRFPNVSSAYPGGLIVFSAGVSTINTMTLTADDVISFPNATGNGIMRWRVVKKTGTSYAWDSGVLGMSSSHTVTADGEYHLVILSGSRITQGNSEPTVSQKNIVPGTLSVTALNPPPGVFSGNSADWVTANDTSKKAFLVADDLGSVMGGETVEYTNGKLVFEAKNPFVGLFDISTYKLFIAKKFLIASMPDSKTIITENPPKSGSYIFSVTESKLFDFTEESVIKDETGEITLANAPANYTDAEKQEWVDFYTRQEQAYGTFNKIEGLYAQERRGYISQDPLIEVGKVGAAVANDGDLNGVTIRELKILEPSASDPTLSNYGSSTGEAIPIKDIHGLPNTDPESKTVNRTTTNGLDINNHTNPNPTEIPSSAFANTAKLNEMDQISIIITYPQGLNSMNQEDGNLSVAYAIYKFRISFTTNGVTSDWITLFGKNVQHHARTRAGISYEHIIDLESFRPFDTFVVQIARQTRSAGLPVGVTGTSAYNIDDKTKYFLTADATVSKIQCIIKDKFTYPYTALVNTIFSSRQYSRVPKRTYEMRGLLIQVPSSYTPREYSTSGKAKYEKFWDGSFKDTLQYTDNPAWCFYDIVTNNRYGAGQYIKDYNIDKYSLYRVARYCDELISTGKPEGIGNLITGEHYRIKVQGTTTWSDFGASANTVGTEFRFSRNPDAAFDPSSRAERIEPRYRINIFLTKATDVYKVLKDMATTFLGIIYWLDNQITVVPDLPSDSVYNFSKSNVIDGRFSYEGTGAKNRYNQIIVTWSDPEAGYELVPLLIEDKSDIAKTGRVITQEVVAFGCTSESQAIRYGKWKLWTAQNQREVVTFKTSFSAAFVRPGDVVNVQDSDRFGVSYSGRVKSGTTGSLVLDRDVLFLPNNTYELNLVITEPSAFYSGAASITINGTTYNTGNRIPEAYIWTGASYVLKDLNTEAKAANAFLSSTGDVLLPLDWRPYTYVQAVEITNPGAGGATSTDAISFSTALDKVPTGSLIWSLKEMNSDNAEVLGSAKAYKVLDIVRDAKNIFSITAVEHYNQKFTAIEEEYELGAIPDSAYVEREPSVIPPPRNLTASFEGPQGNPQGEILLAWDYPVDDSWVNYYEIVHDVPDTNTPIPTSSNGMIFKGFD